MTARCIVCDSTRGSLIQLLAGWVCLAHLPGMGKRRHPR